ncbi:MAG: wyosine base formation [Ilumatobacteraceae bacterium]|nr:wyosine base formation [Ilumatobacteraceae bacterium]
MDDLVAALDQQHAELATLVDGCDDADWQQPTRCEGWDVASVLLHLAQTDELGLQSATGALDHHVNGVLGSRDEQTVTVDDAAADRVANERAAGGDAIRERWHRSSVALREAISAGDPHRRVTWVSGRLSLRTLAATRLSECWIHTGDIAAALGIELAPSDRLRHIARLAWRTLPYAFERDDMSMAGPVALDLVGPQGDAWKFDPDQPAVTTISGSAVEFCDVAARRVAPECTSLTGSGPDVAAVLRLVRTYAL